MWMTLVAFRENTALATFTLCGSLLYWLEGSGLFLLHPGNVFRPRLSFHDGGQTELM
jgi:hypothetical protein